jgi:hypothetical protein
MANNYSSASFAIPVKDGDLTRQRMTAIEAFVEEGDNDDITLPHDLFGVKADDWANRLDARREDHGALGFDWQVDGSDLYFSHNETIDMESAVLVAQFLLDLDDNDKTYAATWADTCSAPRVDEFGGGAVAFNRRESKWKTTYEMAAALAAALTGEGNGSVRHRTCQHCGQDIEGVYPFVYGEWRDRGNNTHCPTEAGDKGQQHAPVQES